MDNLVYIYGLKCPIDNEIRYVGRSSKPLERYKSHFYPHRTEPTGKRIWIESLLKERKKPILEILDMVKETDDYYYCEIMWIKKLNKKGCRLFNRHGISYGDIFEKGTKDSFFRRARLKLRLTQRDVTHYVGGQENYVSACETGGYVPDYYKKKIRSFYESELFCNGINESTLS